MRSWGKGDFLPKNLLGGGGSIVPLGHRMKHDEGGGGGGKRCPK